MWKTASRTFSREPGALHTARSRNDQIALDIRLWIPRATTAPYAQITRSMERVSLAQADAMARR
jgi:argininosuccinate lyase